ncbi:MAG: peptidylprolyl isomerase [Rhodospirillales bacterium]|nr:peptidylprolyl isomerase [Rhodospirillales bacterium]
MTKAKAGDNVKIHYTGKLDDGTTFDSSAGRDPLSFTLGASMVIVGFDEAVVGMAVGESKTVAIPPERGYGPRDEAKIQQMDRSSLPDDIPLDIGLQLQAQSPDGQTMLLIVTALDDTTVTLDGNPPLAGQNMTFDIELVEIG